MIILVIRTSDFALKTLVSLMGTLFPKVQIAWTGAAAGPLGGPQGGVAVLVPQQYQLESSATLVPGLALQGPEAVLPGPGS